ncbi:inter-alpha-trypsin inhibitor heavy chain H4-like, partial [Ylistrum balloti]|uniref:inter-alpha-trypsin inhibitor heavy chain H4-like n=1 Tax=Ylistrum balloti TaxID=509963 RepID=UPI002905A506
RTYTMFLFVTITVSLLTCMCSTNDEITPPSIKTLLVESNVYSRFADVHVTSKVVNEANEGRAAMFSIQVPTEAFVTDFSMENEGRILHGVVKEKKEAEEAYEAARKDGQTAGQVTQSAPPSPGRDMKTFVVHMNVAANSEAIFKLSYQELIEKVLGNYTQKIHIEPNQIVENLTVVASFQEPQGIDVFSYALPDSEVSLSSSTPSKNTLVYASETKQELIYNPSVEAQQDVSGDGESIGLKGNIALTYTLTPLENNGGTLIVNDGSFVHYFSPSGLSAMRKSVIFVLDVSGSMGGRKLEQVKEAMHLILMRLRDGDYFNIIIFSGNVERWKSSPVLASNEHISSAKSYVDGLEAGGSTNINDALLSGVLDLNNALINKGNLVVFLTDGVQTAGETNETIILQNIQLANNNGLVSIFCLGFGRAVNIEFLERISLDNNGYVYIIYEDEVYDASEQLDKFYRGIESVLLRNIEFQYPANLVVTEDLTETTFSNFFNGTEIIVAGNLQQEADIVSTPLTASINAIGVDNDVTFTSTAEPETGETQHFVHRLWAYKKTKDYLDRALKTSGDEKKRYEQKALELALRYTFVTRLTSMVVTEAVNAGFSENDESSLFKAGVGIQTNVVSNEGLRARASALISVTCVVITFLVHF